MFEGTSNPASLEGKRQSFKKNTVEAIMDSYKALMADTRMEQTMPASQTQGLTPAGEELLGLATNFFGNKADTQESGQMPL